VANQRQTGLLNPWMADLPAQAGRTTDQAHVQTERRIVEQGSDAHPVRQQ
jgi:hypothetical protein